jgi:hypothetical protein
MTTTTNYLSLINNIQTNDMSLTPPGKANFTTSQKPLFFHKKDC